MSTQIKFWFTLFCLFCGLSAFAQNTTNNTTTLKGTWSYSVPDVPDGYEKGTIEFKQVEDKLTATLKNVNGTYTLRDIKRDNQQFTSTFYVDGSEVGIKFSPQTDKITGIVKVEGYELPITLTPVKE
ncbi:MAG: hypothetical protein LBE79_03465 [Tannerella sp.]|jgi:hypothetical protein|nr:hypothetical protein [Tannerella sp.]